MFMFGVLHDDVLEPLMHEIADLSRAYERVHRIQATVVPYSVPRFVANNSSNLLYAIVVSLLSPSSFLGRTLASTQAFTFFATYSLTKVVVPRAVPSIF